MPTFTLTSIKGGVTKSTSTVNIAHGLAQTGQTTPDNPVDIVIGATPDFLQAVQFSLEAAMKAAQGKPPHVTRRT